ncbi:MAG: hypothetical protein Q8S57_06715 [Methanoregula sp.]|nr:hypothetical protein [Methanoregula sp.]
MPGNLLPVSLRRDVSSVSLGTAGQNCFNNLVIKNATGAAAFILFWDMGASATLLIICPNTCVTHLKNEMSFLFQPIVDDKEQKKEIVDLMFA